MAENKFHVFASVRNQKDLESLQKEAKEKNVGEYLIPIILDVTKEEQIKEATQTVQSFLSKHPQLELISVVNNAGISARIPSEYIDVNHAKVKKKIFIFIFLF